jgi:predicted ATPase
MQIEQEASLSPDEVVFLDRAIPDALAYYRSLSLPEDEKILKALQKASYKKVFILDILPMVQDYARNEDGAAQKRIHSLIREVYVSLGFPMVRVPILPPEQRVDFILKQL